MKLWSRFKIRMECFRKGHDWELDMLWLHPPRIVTVGYNDKEVDMGMRLLSSLYCKRCGRTSCNIEVEKE